ETELPVARRGIGAIRGEDDLRLDVPAQTDGVGKGVQGESMLGHAGDIEEVGDATEGEQEVIVGKRSGGCRDLSLREIECGDRGLQNVELLIAPFAEREGDVSFV